MAVVTGAGWNAVIGQPEAVARLKAWAARPLHAYLLVGPAGSGKRAAARAFAAEVLGDDRALTESHPDLVVVERVGPYISIEQAEAIRSLAVRSPMEGERKVLVLVDFHLVRPDTAAALLKTIEEPPPSTVFVVLAEHVPPALVTIASRCVTVELTPVPTHVLVEALVSSGVAPDVAAEVAVAALGRVDRARLLAGDPGFRARLAMWKAVPSRLDGSGAAASQAAADLVSLLDGVAAVLDERHSAELVELDELEARYGVRVPRKPVDERHKREKKRLRDDELRFGLSVLQAGCRDAAVSAREPAHAMAGAAAIQEATAALERNPNVSLLMQALLIRLGPSR